MDPRPAAGPPLLEAAPHSTVGRWRAAPADLAVLAALAWWATFLVGGTGGREPGALTVGCLLLAAAVALVRPGDLLAPRAVLLATAPGLAAVLVLLTSPTGLAGAHEAASYAYAGLLGLVTLAWAGTPGRRTVVLGVLLASAGLQFAHGWLPWWGMQDQRRLFVGTFYWHNQAGIFLAAGALLALGVLGAGRRPLAALGWVVAPLAVAGTVYSTSRGSQLGLILGLVLLLAGALVVRRLRPAGLRVLGAALLAGLVTHLLAGPPFFAERVAATAGTAARSESFVSNGVQRFEDWRRALAIFAEWPVSGAGFYSFDSATGLVTTRRDGVGTAFAHNGYLQALADGGLVLFVPLVLVLALVGWTTLRALPATLRAGDLAGYGVAVTLLVLLLHSGMDFDWTYPALLSLTALVAALCPGVRAAAAGPPAPSAPVRHGLTAAPVLLLLGAALLAAGGGLDLNAVVPPGEAR